MVCNIGGARCASYGAQMATRVLTAFLISPPIGNGSGLVTELCEPEHRAQSLGWWTLMTTIGTPAGPFFMGFVVKHIGVQWIFWIFAIINFCQFLFYLAFGEETVCSRLNKPKPTGFWGKMVPRKISSHSLNPQDIIAPFFLSQYPRVLIAAFAHAITFCYGNIVLIVEMPIVFGDKFHFDAQQIGLQFLAIIIGCLLGEQISGPMCDWFLGRVHKSKGHSYPADRLWLSYIGFATVFAGLLTWGFQLQHATTTWNITPCVGAAIASFGNQMQTTILTTFAVESKKEQSSQVGVFVNFCRLVYGFVRFPFRLLTFCTVADMLFLLAWPILFPGHVHHVGFGCSFWGHGRHCRWMCPVSYYRNSFCGNLCRQALGVEAGFSDHQRKFRVHSEVIMSIPKHMARYLESSALSRTGCDSMLYSSFLPAERLEYS